MPALPKNVVGAVEKRKVKVYFADRTTTKYWNDRRNKDDLRFFGGWYWYEEVNGKASETENGPFKSESAAYRDAFLSLSLRRLRDEELTTQIRGTGVVTPPAAATASPKKANGKKAKAEKKAPDRAVRASVKKKLEGATANRRDAANSAAPQRGRRSSSFQKSLAASRQHLGRA